MQHSKKDTLTRLLKNPLVASVRNDEGLDAVINCSAKVVFLLSCNILNVSEYCQRISDSGKEVFVHIDLVDGLASVPVSVDFIAQKTCASGILTTHTNMIKRAKELGLLPVYRIFLLDGVALQRAKRNITSNRPDFLEMLPGMMPSIVKQLTGYSSVPIIAGGLLTTETDIRAALQAGAIAVSTTNPDLWGDLGLEAHAE